MKAYHFFLLAQRQMYEGAIDAAMKTVSIKAHRPSNLNFANAEAGMLPLKLKARVAFDV